MTTELRGYYGSNGKERYKESPEDFPAWLGIGLGLLGVVLLWLLLVGLHGPTNNRGGPG